MTDIDLPVGYYTHPTEDHLCIAWNGEEVTGPFHKDEVRKAYTANGGQGTMVFWDYPQLPTDAPVEEPVTETPATPPRGGSWSYTKFPNNPNAPLLCRYSDGINNSEYFDGEVLAEEVWKPEFIRQGGPESWFDEGCPHGPHADLFKLVMNRISPEQAKAIIGETATIYNSGPTWISDKDNPNLARWWDGNDFTGETELIGVIHQRAYDKESGSSDTVSLAPGLTGTEAGSWHADPADNTYLIRWGGARWDKRRSVEDMLTELFSSLGESVPEMWRGPQVMSNRHSELIEQLTARKEGVNGWYKEPSRFDDLHMRVWHDGQWTEQTSAQQPGWYSDPFNDEILRVWNGSAWTAQTTTKEAERVRLEREEQRRQKREAFKDKVFIAVADYYSADKIRQRKIDEANDRSRRLRDAAAVEQAQFYRDRPVRQKYFWQK